ncbi:MAG: GNAT family N-acetyltransferase [Candidatus Baltobacteraceae bacterium]
MRTNIKTTSHSQNEQADRNVAHDALELRFLRESDVAGLRDWGRHDDALFAPYNVPVLSESDVSAFWRRFGTSDGMVSLAGLIGGRLIAHVVLRIGPAEPQIADVGIAIDPALLGRGFGRALLLRLRTFARVELGIVELTLDVAAYNRRAIRAYLAAGFRERSRRWMPYETPIDFAGLLTDPRYDWLREHVRIDDGYSIDVVRMTLCCLPAKET